MAKRPPRGANFEKLKMTKENFYKGALKRLEDDVGTILECVKTHNKNSERKIGFWSGIRLLMPIIEAVAHVSGETPQVFLGSRLHVKVPNLTWDLFRHSLTHGDFLHGAKYQDNEVGWAVHIEGVKHEVIKAGKRYFVVGLDILTLFNDLKKYLETEINKKDQTIVEVEVGVNYLNPKQKVKEEFDNLSGLSKGAWSFDLDS